LRRKAQEHSAALLHSLHAVAISGLSFPGMHFPPLSLHHALVNRKNNGHLTSDYISDLSMQHNNNNNSSVNGVVNKTEPTEKVEINVENLSKNCND